MRSHVLPSLAVLGNSQQQDLQCLLSIIDVRGISLLLLASYMQHLINKYIYVISLLRHISQHDHRSPLKCYSGFMSILRSKEIYVVLILDTDCSITMNILFLCDSICNELFCSVV